MAIAVQETRFDFPIPFRRTRGKVRDIYTFEEDIVALVATDRISAFDVILDKPIPHKGQVLNLLAATFLAEVRHICPVAALRVPDANITVALKCNPIPIEIVVRGHLCGHAWRLYQSGVRMICGVHLPDGLRENDPLPNPIITPTTKSEVGHDMDITENEILKSQLLDAEEWGAIQFFALQLFAFGQQWARDHGLILADTKYEFGERDLQIYLIDEIHTPDSSRYFIAEGFEARQAAQLPQEQYSKEFVRKWLISQGFQGLPGQPVPALPPDFVDQVSARYIDVYQRLLNEPFEPRTDANPMESMQAHLWECLKELGLF
jgi:phosphoribosylaminoimidazole-succinocarboxamide synthase